MKPRNQNERELRKFAQYSEAQAVLKRLGIFEEHKFDTYDEQVDLAFRALQLREGRLITTLRNLLTDVLNVGSFSVKSCPSVAAARELLED